MGAAGRNADGVLLPPDCASRVRASDTTTYPRYGPRARYGEPTLGRYLWTDFFDPQDVDVLRVYPKPYSREALPSNVAKAYQLALRDRGTDPAFYAVGVRRTLEAICDHEGIPRTGKRG